MEPRTYLQPDLYLEGVRITEASITLTSLLITLVCFYAFRRLGKAGLIEDSTRLFRIFLVLMGLSTLIGGLVGHAFTYALPFVFKAPGWILGVIAVSALEQASIVRARSYIGRTRARIVTWLNVGTLFIGLWLILTILWFPIVEIQAAFGMLLVVGLLEGYLLWKTGRPTHRYILLSLPFAVAGALVHVLKFSPSIWFNFFDVGHVLICGTIWMIMRGAEVEQQEAPPEEIAIANDVT